jgi:hypothetical protein
MKSKLSAPPVALDTPPLRDELAAVEREFPGWHCWKSDAGVMHATACRCAYGEGSGTTLTAGTPALLRYAVAAQLHEWAVSGVPA